MPIAQRTATSGVAASGAGFTVTLPTGTVIGDYVVLAVANAGTAGPATPSGWTLEYGASAGSGQFLSIFVAPFRDNPSLNFTNAASIAAWACNSYWIAGFFIDRDPEVATNLTTNNTTLPTGAPTPSASGSFEILLYAWTSAATIATPAANSTIEITRANSTTISTALGRNNNTSLPSGVACTAFSHTLSATNNRKTGVGLVLRSVPIPGEIPPVLSEGTSTVDGALRAPRIDVAGTAIAGSSADGTVRAKRQPANTLSVGRATVSVSLTRARSLTGASAGSAANTVTMARKRPVTASAAGTASTATATIYRKRALVAVSGGVSSTTGFILRKRAIVGLSAGVGTASVTILNKIKNLIVNPSNGSTTVFGRVFNRTMVVWTGSTFAVEGPYPVVLWDGAEFKTVGDMDMVTWREPNDYFDLVVA